MYMFSCGGQGQLTFSSGFSPAMGLGIEFRMVRFARQVFLPTISLAHTWSIDQALFDWLAKIAASSTMLLTNAQA